VCASQHVTQGIQQGPAPCHHSPSSVTVDPSGNKPPTKGRPVAGCGEPTACFATGPAAATACCCCCCVEVAVDVAAVATLLRLRGFPPAAGAGGGAGGAWGAAEGCTAVVVAPTTPFTFPVPPGIAPAAAPAAAGGAGGVPAVPPPPSGLHPRPPSSCQNSASCITRMPFLAAAAILLAPGSSPTTTKSVWPDTEDSRVAPIDSSSAWTWLRLTSPLVGCCFSVPARIDGHRASTVGREVPTRCCRRLRHAGRWKADVGTWEYWDNSSSTDLHLVKGGQQTPSLCHIALFCPSTHLSPLP
jgi:hypothetical protein